LGAAETSPIAIIAGSGALPQLLLDQLTRKGRASVLVHFSPLPMGFFPDTPRLAAEFEQLGAMFAELKALGCQQAVFAGAMHRPHLDMSRLDAVSKRLISILYAGDDQTLRAIADLFAEQGLEILGVQHIRPDLLAGAGSMGQVAPGTADLSDIARAAELATAIGALDAGQGAVVAQGLCLGLESLQGTDRMLEFVAQTAADLRPDPAGAKGVLVKALKPGQDLRFDLPSIGTETVRAAAKAGLGGIAVTAGGALVLDRGATIAEADRLGLFLYGFEAMTDGG
jgi:DUF1009 family protein